jgi:hypothetical protein
VREAVVLMQVRRPLAGDGQAGGSTSGLEQLGIAHVDAREQHGEGQALPVHHQMNLVNLAAWLAPDALPFLNSAMAARQGEGGRSLAGQVPPRAE